MSSTLPRVARMGRLPLLLTGLCAIGILAALPGRGAASPEQDPARTARLARIQEERVLLEAVRYLRLSREQVNRLHWVAEQTDRRVARLQQEEDRILATVEQNAARARQALLAGKPAPEVDQQQAARLQQQAQQGRAQAEAEVLRFAVPYLVRMLSREQIALAWRLGQGRPPAYAAASPALLDPSAGFAPGAPAAGVTVLGVPGVTGPATGSLIDLAEMEDLGAAAAEAEAERLTALRAAQAARAEATRVQPRVLPGGDSQAHPARPFSGPAARTDQPFPQRVVETANVEQLSDAVLPLARRLFMSPRLAPLLKEGLTAGLGRDAAAEAPAAPAGPARQERDYRFQMGFRDLTGHGPELAPLGGQLRNGCYNFGPGQGLKLTDAGVTDHYALELQFRCGQAEGYQKLVDFKNGARDDGLYLLGQQLTFYRLALGRPVQLVRDHRLRLDRNRATRIVRAYIDGQFAFAFLDLDDDAVFEKRAGIFFVDDRSTGGEQGPGAVCWVQVWDRPEAR